MGHARCMARSLKPHDDAPDRGGGGEGRREGVGGGQQGVEGSGCVGTIYSSGLHVARG